MDVFLSLYVLDDNGESSLLPFLLAAPDDDTAMDISDAFIEAVETVASETATAEDKAQATREIDDLRPTVTLIEDKEEIALVAECLRAHNPNFEEEIAGFSGSVFTVGVNEEAGFTKETTRILRNRMTCHSVLANLSVDLN
ncbi:MAG: hypothetical protein EOP83_09805 [Verrucomicrobiaceae bacterium]|nr:MAG: hypothetical protein EOP83_09805 [Verrucomicrobiaceae bacterium]